MSQTLNQGESGPTGWVKFEDGGSPSQSASPNRKSPTASSGVSSARGSVNSLPPADNMNLNGQMGANEPGALVVSEIQVNYFYTIHCKHLN